MARMELQRNESKVFHPRQISQQGKNIRIFRSRTKDVKRMTFILEIEISRAEYTRGQQQKDNIIFFILCWRFFPPFRLMCDKKIHKKSYGKSSAYEYE